MAGACALCAPRLSGSPHRAVGGRERKASAHLRLLGCQAAGWLCLLGRDFRKAASAPEPACQARDQAHLPPGILRSSFTKPAEASILSKIQSTYRNHSMFEQVL